MLFLIAAGAGVLTAVYWGAVAFHALRTWWRIPTLRAGLNAPADSQPPRICVIVPAHNEESCIALVAASLLGQDYPGDRLSLVFALDRCTDATARVLRDTLGPEGAKRSAILEIDSCPEGWTGKVNALWRAVGDAPAAHTADVLLFIDADTILHPACIRAAANLKAARGLGMLSLLSTLTSEKWFERMVQPAAGMELVRMFPIVRTNWPNQARPFANGQFIMIDREPYLGMRGHEAVHDKVLEDVELARTADRAGVRLGVFLADGLLHCRMYSTWAQFNRGWNRIYMESANRKVSRLRMFAWRMRAFATILPILAAAGFVAGFLAHMLGGVTEASLWALRAGATGTAIYAATLLLCMKLGRSPLIGAAAFPFGAWMVSRILLRCAVDLVEGKPIEWAGRTYKREAR